MVPKIFRYAVLIFFAILFASAFSGCKGQDNYETAGVSSWVGKVPGVISWSVPATPNGLRPTQCWFSIGSSPDGTMYIGASDHKTNAALYSIDPSSESLRYLGDAKAASLEVGNWKANETAEKFHVYPWFYKGRVYVATTDYSNLDAGYLKKRGFHWYAYDITSRKFLDLSANEFGGIAGEHASIMATACDGRNGILYGLDSPRALLFRYDIANGITTNLGRPEFFKNPYYNAGRYIWTDNQGRVYFTVAGINYVLFYDPVKGFGEKKDWELRSRYFMDKCIRMGQWTPDGMRCYLADYEANFYLFNNSDQSFSFLGQGKGDAQHFKDGMAFRIRVMNVTADEKKIYFSNDDAEVFSLFEFEISSGNTRRLCFLSEIEQRFKDRTYFNKAGNASWDNNGRFYIAAFGNELVNSTDVFVTRIDPVLLKAHLGLQELVEIKLEQGAQSTMLTRTGGLDKGVSIILEAVDDKGMFLERRNFLIPQGQRTLEIPNANLPQAGVPKSVLRLVPDGNTYKVSGLK
jgi:hypothetical protein